jgi:hypothetical protein
MEAAQPQRSEHRQAEPQAARDADQRERNAVVRETIADLREGEADQRERDADQRERDADQRERDANHREALADQREREADEREEQMQALMGELRGLVTGAHRDAVEAIERSLALLSVSADSFQRSEEAVGRAAARHRREEAAIARAAAQDKRQQTYTSAAGRGLAGQVREIRTRLSATVATFAEAEDNTARIFDQLAISHPGDVNAYLRRAQQARDAADRARALARKLSA